MSTSVLTVALVMVLGTLPAWSQVAPRKAPQLPAGALKLPLFRQATGYSCGTACLQSVLRYWQVFTGQESQLYDKLGTNPKDGTAPDKLLEVARSFGLTARLKERTTLADLRQALAQGATVILNLQAWREPSTPVKPWKDTWEEGHYVVLVGLDAHYLYAMDPSTSAAYTYLPIGEFLDRWHDFDDRAGTRREYHQLAVFIQGTKPMKRSPGPLVRME